MDLVIRAATMYALLFGVLRIAGKRSMADLTPFNFILLLMVSEATQQALLGNDFSITTAAVVVVTLVGIDIVLSGFKQRFPRFSQWMEGSPLIILDHGKPLIERMRKVQIDEADILQEARRSQGLERLDQIKYAVLEKNGGITIIPYSTGDTK